MRRSCLDCGVLISRGSRCRSCQQARRGSFWRHKLAPAAKARDGYRCRQCGSPKDIEAHHKIALAAGGQDTLENVVTLCRDCHQRITYAKGKTT